MNANQRWKRTVWTFAGMLASGVMGGVLTLAHLRGAPIEGSKRNPGIISATYLEDTVAVYTLRGQNDAEPILLMAGKLEVEMLKEGGREPIVDNFFGFMYVYEEDLREFPSPFVVVHREDGILCQRVETVDTEVGLATLRQAFENAYGRPPKVGD